MIYYQNQRSWCNISNLIFNTTNYAEHFATTYSFSDILYCIVLTKLLNGTIIVFIRPHSKVMLLGIDFSNAIIFNTIVALILDANNLQNKYPQCVGNILNVVTHEKLLEFVEYFNFAISKFDAIAIFQNGNCQASNEAVF